MEISKIEKKLASCSIEELGDLMECLQKEIMRRDFAKDMEEAERSFIEYLNEDDSDVKTDERENIVTYILEKLNELEMRIDKMSPCHIDHDADNQYPKMHFTVTCTL